MSASFGAQFRSSERVWASRPLVVAFAAFVMLGGLSQSQLAAGLSVVPEMQRQGMAGSRMWESQPGSLLVDYYEAFLRDRDLDLFRKQVIARYTEATLGRVLTSSPSVAVRRASVLALGVTGCFEQSNAALAKALRDDDPIVRTLAESALWAIWFCADSPENNQQLDEVRQLIGQHRLDAAVKSASRLITRAPKYAEAYNQRAIAFFMQGRFAQTQRIASACSSSIRSTLAQSPAWPSVRSSSMSHARH